MPTRSFCLQQNNAESNMNTFIRIKQSKKEKKEKKRKHYTPQPT